MAHDIILGLVRGQRIKLTHGESKPLILGRDRRCDVRVKDKYVSRIHAAVEEDKDGFYLADSSINGTFVLPEDNGMFKISPGSRAKLAGRGFISLGGRVDPADSNLIGYSCEE